MLQKLIKKKTKSIYNARTSGLVSCLSLPSFLARCQQPPCFFLVSYFFFPLRKSWQIFLIVAFQNSQLCHPLLRAVASFQKTVGSSAGDKLIHVSTLLAFCRNKLFHTIFFYFVPSQFSISFSWPVHVLKSQQQ